MTIKNFCDVSVIIVNWNAKEYLFKCLKSIFKTTKNIILQIIVVDNNSSDGSVEMLKKEFPNVEIISNSKNVGFATANNRGIKQSRGKFLLFVNPDIEFYPNSLNLMLNHLKSLPPYVGAVGPQIIYKDGDIYPSCWKFPSLIAEFWGRVKLKKIFPRSKISLQRKRVFYEQPRYVEVVSGACVLIKKSILKKVGYWDEDYFLYYEDDDLFYRFKKNNFKVVYYPPAKVYHYGGRSTSQNIRSAIWMYTGLFLFFKKHKKRIETFFLTLICLKKLLKFYIKYRTNVFAIIQGKYR